MCHCPFLYLLAQNLWAWLTIMPGGDHIKNISIINLSCTGLEHSDWLKMWTEPIRVLKNEHSKNLRKHFFIGSGPGLLHNLVSFVEPSLGSFWFYLILFWFYILVLFWFYFDSILVLFDNIFVLFDSISVLFDSILVLFDSILVLFDSILILFGSFWFYLILFWFYLVLFDSIWFYFGSIVSGSLRTSLLKVPSLSFKHFSRQNVMSTTTMTTPLFRRHFDAISRRRRYCVVTRLARHGTALMLKCNYAIFPFFIDNQILLGRRWFFYLRRKKVFLRLRILDSSWTAQIQCNQIARFFSIFGHLQQVKFAQKDKIWRK